ncbi:MAG: FMN-binding protein, partial [Pseudomonadales bacterium]|nr:FMN-binding protein [Pseudomonadales bacterium]
MHIPHRYTLGLLCLLLQLALAGAARSAELTLGDVQQVFPEAASISALDGKTAAYLVRGPNGPLGYAFSTEELAPISAYSGKPINTVVGLGEDGLIRGVHILHHEEPILVIGISDQDLQDFIDQFEGRKSTDRIRVGAQGRPGYVGIDGISGATITTMVLTSSVSKAVHSVASAYGIPAGAAPGKPGAQAP